MKFNTSFFTELCLTFLINFINLFLSIMLLSFFTFFNFKILLTYFKILLQFSKEFKHSSYSDLKLYPLILFTKSLVLIIELIILSFLISLECILILFNNFLL